MSQSIFDTIVPSTTSGNQLAALLNSFKDAVVSGFSGTSRPSQLQAGGYWIDTSADASGVWTYKIYDGSQDITVFTLNKNTGLAAISNADSLFQVTKSSSDITGPIVRMLKKRASGLGQTLSGDVLGEVQFQGTRDDGVTTLQARVRSVSSNDVVSGSQGAYLTFEITTLNGSAPAEVMRVVDGKLAIGLTSPDEAIHALGNVKVEVQGDNSNPSQVKFRKKRLANSGQVNSGDTIGRMEFLSTNDAGAEIQVATIDVTAKENHTSIAHGTGLSIKTKRVGATALTEQISIDDNVNVKTNLTVDGNLTVSGTTTTVNSTTIEVADSNITVNKGGNQTSANTNRAGITVEISGGTNARIGYDSTRASRFVVGDVGSESEIATVGATQTFTNKTLTSPVLNSPSIVTPSRLDARQDTEANLTTYAATATNGQIVFSTDTKTMYQVLDGALVNLGSGSGGGSIVWQKLGDLSPANNSQDGISLEGFSSVDTQEIYVTINVPSSYNSGGQIKLTDGAFFVNATSGNVRFRAQATLLRAGTTILGTYSNIHTSTNASVEAPGVANRMASIGTIDLTNSSGQISGVSVAAGDKIRVRLYRDIANEGTSASATANLMINNFNLAFR